MSHALTGMTQVREMWAQINALFHPHPLLVLSVISGAVSVQLKTGVCLNTAMPIRSSDLQHPATLPKAKCNTGYDEDVGP